MSMEEFGKSILSLRQNANMTQEELALRMGVTPQAISKWERGQSLPDLSIFTELCKALNVSADTLLGMENSGTEEDAAGKYPEEVLKNLRFSLEPLVLSFGEDLVQAFLNGDYMGPVAKQRVKLSWEGILLPVVRLRDDLKLDPNEFVIKIYDRILYREKIKEADKAEEVDETVLEYMIQTLGNVVKDNYGELLNRDIVKTLTDNLRREYPALIEGIVPDKIPYGLLQEVYKLFLVRGNAPKYLPKVIESMENVLHENPEITVEQLAECVCKQIEQDQM